MNRLRDIQLSYTTCRYPYPGGSIRLEAQMWKPSANSTQKANFSVCGSTYDTNGRCVGGGQVSPEHLDLHLLTPRDKQVVELRKWHLMGLDGPLHYAANAAYWYLRHLYDSGKLPEHKLSYLRTYTPPRYESTDAEKCLKHFRSTVIFGTIEGDEMPQVDLTFPPEPPKSLVYIGLKANEYETAYDKWVDVCHKHVSDQIHRWCEKRYVTVMNQFEQDMIDFWGKEIVSE